MLVKLTRISFLQDNADTIEEEYEDESYHTTATEDTNNEKFQDKFVKSNFRPRKIHPSKSPKITISSNKFIYILIKNNNFFILEVLFLN